MSISNKIKELAKEKHLTLSALEKELGFGNGTIGKWDSHSPSCDKLMAVAKFLGASTDVLLGMDISAKDSGFQAGLRSTVDFGNLTGTVIGKSDGEVPSYGSGFNIDGSIDGSVGSDVNGGSNGSGKGNSGSSIGANGGGYADSDGGINGGVVDYGGKNGGDNDIDVSSVNGNVDIVCDYSVNDSNDEKRKNDGRGVGGGLSDRVSGTGVSGIGDDRKDFYLTSLSEIEMKVITAYRKHPEIQVAICSILGVNDNVGGNFSPNASQAKSGKVSKHPRDEIRAVARSGADYSVDSDNNDDETKIL